MHFQSIIDVVSILLLFQIKCKYVQIYLEV